MPLSIVEGGFDVIVPGHGTLDAAVGRRVLMYQPDAVNAVTQLARAIRSGGIIAFHEHDTVFLSDSRALLPLHNQVGGWLRDMLRLFETESFPAPADQLQHFVARIHVRPGKAKD